MKKTLLEWSLEKNRKDILVQWDKVKNGDLAPNIVSYGSEKIVFWHCHQCENRWEAKVCRRTSKNGSGCPICSKKAQREKTLNTKLTKNGSLLDNYPDLSKEWDYQRNGEKLPDHFLSGSNKVVWWKCPVCDAGYQARINSRVHGSKCTKCKVERRNATLVLTKGSLYDVKPSLEKEWHPSKNGKITIKDITAYSNKKYWWICEKGHEWEVSASTRNKGHGCPYCAGIYPSKENNLLAVAPSLSREWHPSKNGELKPEDVMPFTMKKVWWRCKRGHEWQASVSNRYQGRNCAQCSSELRSSFPEQAIIYYLSKYFAIDSRTRHNGWEVDIYLPDYHIGIEYDGIAYHDKTFLQDREKRKNEALKQIGLDLIRVKESYSYQGTNKQTIFFLVDHSYKNFPEALQMLFDLIAKKSGTKLDISIDIDRDRIEIMNQYIMIQKKNSFEAKYPKLALLWNNNKNMSIQPNAVSPMSNKKVWWICEKNHEWQESVINVAKGNGCPYCSNHRVLIGYNDFQTLYPDLANEWDYDKNNEFKPSDVTVGSNKKVWWKCKNGHEWRATIARRVKGPTCPHCSRRHKKVPLNEEAWMSKYEQAKAYYLEHNHLNIKATHVCDNGFKLGSWIRTQRISYKNNDLTLKRYKLLEEIGMIWSSTPGVKKS